MPARGATEVTAVMTKAEATSVGDTRTHTHELSKPPRRQHLASSLHSLGQWPLTLGTT